MSRSCQTLAVAVLAAQMLRPAMSLAQDASDEFFIISSVNPAKQQVVVKLPTEVTEIVFVSSETKYVDRGGRAIGLADLHAGDTVFVRRKRDANGMVALEIRKGPMTVSELQKRYLRTKS